MAGLDYMYSVESKMYLKKGVWPFLPQERGCRDWSGSEALSAIMIHQ